MSRPPKRSAPDAPAPDATPEMPAPTPDTGASMPFASLADLPVAGLTRRRMALLLGALVAAWVIVLFARQVSEASEASSHADAMRASNVVLEAQVAAAQRELQMIQRPGYIAQQAREYRLGMPREIPFTLADDAPPLGPDAPGSAAVRLGAVADRRSPIESWLDLLFGTPDEPEGALTTAPG